VAAANATGTIGTVSTIDKCYRTASTCSDPGTGPRVINDYPVTRACWQWSNLFDCVTADASSDCSQPRFGQCTEIGAPTCVEWDTITAPPRSPERLDFVPDRGSLMQTGRTQATSAKRALWDWLSADADFAVGRLPKRSEAGKYRAAGCRCSRVSQYLH
jgi:hypothetical protein